MMKLILLFWGIFSVLRHYNQAIKNFKDSGKSLHRASSVHLCRFACLTAYVIKYEVKFRKSHHGVTCSHWSNFLTIKQSRCTNFSNLFLEWNSTCFGQFLCTSSGVFHCAHNNGLCHTGLLTYTIAVSTVKNSWWWTEELSETCKVSFQG